MLNRDASTSTSKEDAVCIHKKKKKMTQEVFLEKISFKANQKR